MRLRSVLVISSLVLAPALGACGEDTAELVGVSNTGGAAGLMNGDAGCVISPCASKVFACGNCLDDDVDGLVDADDPDCLGSCDDSEDVYAPKLPGNPGAPCRTDCFWDVGNGAGNDDCEWDHRCDPLAVPPDSPPEGPGCAYDEDTKLTRFETCAEAETGQSQQCRDRCSPLVPNGCDCFGCCSVPGAPTPVWMGSLECVPSALGDPAKCKPCTQVPSCSNPCEECEVCIGKPQPTTTCTPATQCPTGAAACGLPDQPSCPGGRYCITGCCITLPA